jgi:hypothetical protein
MNNLLRILRSKFIEEHKNYLRLRDRLAAVHAEKADAERRIRELVEAFLRGCPPSDQAASGDDINRS